MRNPGDWKRAVCTLAPAAVWAGFAITRGDTQQSGTYWVVAGLFEALAVYYLIRPAAKKPPDAP